MKRIPFFLILMATFSSCSDELSRRKAKNLVTDFYEYPNVEYASIYRTLDGTIWGSYEDKYRALEGQGLISIKKSSGGWWGPTHYVEFTGEGEGYSLQDYEGIWAVPESPLDIGNGKDKLLVITNIREFNEITGITYRDENNGQIEFSVKRVSVTPFGEVHDIKENDTVHYTVDIKKYDDGWRIVNRKEKNLKPKEFPDVFDSKKAELSDKEIAFSERFIGKWEGNYSYYTVIRQKNKFHIEYSYGGDAHYDGLYKLEDESLIANGINVRFSDAEDPNAAEKEPGKDEFTMWNNLLIHRNANSQPDTLKKVTKFNYE